jgi:surface protein
MRQLIQILLFSTSFISCSVLPTPFVNERGCIVCEGLKAGNTFTLNSTEYTVADKGLLKEAIQMNIPLNQFCTSNMVNMDSLFYRTLSNHELSSWDVSNVVSMYRMFDNAYFFNQDISNWDVGNVINMSCMFWDAENFNQSLEDWNVSRVIDMSGMFCRANSFNRNISSWDVSHVQDMRYMFQGNKVFSQDLSAWCLPFIKSEPAGFGSFVWRLPNKSKPKWGSCP